MTRNRWRQGRDRRQLTSDYKRFPLPSSWFYISFLISCQWKPMKRENQEEEIQQELLRDNLSWDYNWITNDMRFLRA